jgi:hypothetical protein
MLFNKVKSLAICSSVVCGILALITSVLVFRQAGQYGGRLLSVREMATVFGDNTANNLCGYSGQCDCTRVSGTQCTTCGPNGNLSDWILCSSGNNLYCSENGSAVCNLSGMDKWYVNDGDYNTNNGNACEPCSIDTGIDWIDSGTACSRKDAGNGYNPCGS